MSKSPKEIGDEWEEKVKASMQGSVQPGSGNQWHSKLDVKSERILWSCKATEAEAGYRITPKLMQEAVEASYGPGGTGTLPALAIKTTEMEFVVFRLEDFLDLMTQPIVLAQAKADARRVSSSIPELFRD